MPGCLVLAEASHSAGVMSVTLDVESFNVDDLLCGAVLLEQAGEDRTNASALGNPLGVVTNEMGTGVRGCQVCTGGQDGGAELLVLAIRALIVQVASGLVTVAAVSFADPIGGIILFNPSGLVFRGSGHGAPSPHESGERQG